MKRRAFIQTVGAVGGTLAVPRILRGEEKQESTELYGVLIDTTRCAGCRSCELACAEAHHLPEPDTSDDLVFERERHPSELSRTVVNRYVTENGEIYAKKQCMHCIQPACGAACLTQAMFKTDQGPVVWRGDKCMGCRYCMISCPFDIPKFEYHSANPNIQKCDMCWERMQEGKSPACVENCPAEALMFGKRSELLEEARRRIYADPDNYNHHIYGEHEAGGTGVLYLTSVPTEQIGLSASIGTQAYPEHSKEFLYAVPVILTLLPAFLYGLSRATKREEPQPGQED